MANKEKEEPKKPVYSASQALSKSLDRARALRGTDIHVNHEPVLSHTEPISDEPVGRFTEVQPTPITLDKTAATWQTRRSFLVYGTGALAAAAGFWYILPEDTQTRLFPEDAQKRFGVHLPETNPTKEAFLNRSIKFDDDIAEALYSKDRSVPTYDKSQAQSPDQLRNNYDGQTPDPAYLDDWKLTLVGLASGQVEHLTLADIKQMVQRAGPQDQVTRLCCVEGWSAIAWWSGLRFADLLAAYPPAANAKWVRLDSSVNLDSDGNEDPYYVSIDLPTAQHPQTVLATHQSDKPLTVEHGAPLRLVAPMKLGLKNIKAITKISYTEKEPADYWNERGYSKYDGL